MIYEFLSEMALGTDEAEIDQAVLGKGRYLTLQKAPWTVRGHVVATGLAEDDSYVTLLKNGRKENPKKNLSEIKGYPQIVRSASEISLSSDWSAFFLPQSDHLALSPLYSALFQFDLELTSPFYSRDDLAFYPIDNPLRREWIFDAPYLGAAGVKGLLRWAWQMCWSHEKMDMETRLFGPRQDKLKEENAKQGCVYTYPLFWKGKVGLDVINPHSRSTGTGTIPIKYEIVKQGGTTSLYLLLVNREEDVQFGYDALGLLEDPLILLLEHSGLSAKRSSGWGSVDVVACRAWVNVPYGQGASVCQTTSEDDIWAGLTDGQGNLKPIEHEQTFTTAKLAGLTGESKSWVKKNKAEARSRVIGMWEKDQEEPDVSQEDEFSANKPETVSHEAKSIKELAKDLQKTFVDLKKA